MNKFTPKTNINPKKVYLALEFNEGDRGREFIMGYLHAPNRTKDSFFRDYPWLEWEISEDFSVDKEYPHDKHRYASEYEDSILGYRDCIGAWDIYELNYQKEAFEILNKYKMMQELVS